MKPTTIGPPMKDPRDPSELMSSHRMRKNKGENMEYRALLEAAPDAIVVVNQPGTIVLVNDQAEKLFGYCRDELIGQPAEILVSQGFRGQHSDQHSRFVAVPPERPTVVGMELFGLRKDGSEFPAEIRLSPLATKEGILVSSAIRDISARSRTEEDLRRLASIVACSDDAIIGKTLEGIITSWNAGAERMYGYSANEAIGKSVSILVPVNRPDEIPKVLERLKRGEIVDHFETLRVRKNGEEFHIEITVSPIRDAMERVVGASASCRDISERKRTHIAIREERDRAQQYLDIADVILLALDLEGRITLLNRKGCSMLGWEERELLGRNWMDTCLPSRTQDVLRRSFHNLLAGDLSYIENPVVTKSGEERMICWRNAQLRDGAGCIIGTLSSGEDITERKRAEQNLLKSEARARALVESNIIGIATGDLDGKLIEANEACLRLVGYSREDLLSGEMRWDVLTPPEYHDADQRAVEQLKSVGVASPWEKQFFRKDGSRISVLIGVTTRVAADGDVECVSFVLDISERKQLEQQLRQAQKMEAVGRLAGGIAHDFNNLLGVIIGYSEIFEERLGLSDPLRPKAEQIKKAGLRAATLTRQLLAFSRQQVLEPKVLDLNAVVADTLKMLQRVLGEDIELIASPGPELGRIKADQGQIEQVIMNLAVNARDAMPHGGTLRISTTNEDLDEVYVLQHPEVVVPGSYVMFAVSDTGCGMDRETQTKIFEPFFTTKELGKGTGLGLATVYGVVKQSGGYIWVYSELGRGSTFKIYLPRIEEALTASDSGKGGKEIGRGWETILLVEDAQPLRELAHELLEDSGYTVLEAANGADAIQVAEQHQGPIHLLLTDVVMPGMDGPKVAEYMTRICPGIKVLYASGYTDDTIVHHGVLNSGIALLQKPFTRATLTNKVREVLGLPEVHEIGGPSARVDEKQITAMPRILIVDDDEAMRGLLRERLEGMYQIFGTGDPEEAIALALQHKPDAILLDLMMPRFSGFEVCQTLTALSFTQQIPIFIVSGEAATKYKVFCQNLGSAGYFEKPVDFNLLKACLAAVLRAKRPELRAEARVRFNVILKLQGKDKDGTPFELFTTTENVSATGFLCGCTAALEVNATLDVFLCHEGEHYAGTARVIRTESGETPCPRYAFRFVKKPVAWILQ
jgi:two-component system cell cycle sensor histidine kinase/response regulator CckA